MSTILDALRKVERERDSSPDQLLDASRVAPELHRRRHFPVTAIALCAVLGFAGGAVLSWLLPAQPRVEVAALPVPPSPPEISVPRAPLRARPVAPSLAEPRNEKSGQLTSPTAATAPSVPNSGDAPAQVVAAGRPDAPAAGVASEPVSIERGPAVDIAKADKQASALEPSPFSPPRDGGREATPASEAPSSAPSIATGAGAAPAGNVGETGLAASAPAVPEAPPSVEADTESEPEPETPVETLVDTGRSPPGAPKVALSFLQWSADPVRRFAFISIDGAPSQRVREGEVAAGLTVAAITKTGVQFKREGTSFMIRPRH